MADIEPNEKKRVLLLEDSDIFADMVMEFLEKSGYSAQRAVNGFEGIKQVYTFLPHLIITDVEMPLFKGYQVTRLLKSRKNTKNIPIIMFTSLNETKDKFWGSQAGADRYLEKSPDNLESLKGCIDPLLAEAPETDFAVIEREGKRINDNALIEMVNNLLDNKLFQTTLIGMLAELSSKLRSLEEIVHGIFGLLNNVCETEIVSMMIKGSENALHVYTANFTGYSMETVNDFTGICVADFNNFFPDFQVVTRSTKDFYPFGNVKKHVESYIMIPLSIAGEQFASVHIANSVKEYFSQNIMENLNIFLSASAAIISNALSLLEMEDLQKKTRTAFARYVPADVMDEIIRRSSEVKNQSETRNVVILFSDIRDFTKISEHTLAQDVVYFLNNYFATMGAEIIAEGGHIDKFIGDAIMAIFGTPRPRPNAPTSAIRAAIKMISLLDKVDSSVVSLPDGGLKIGIGINCGECVVGNIGFQDKMDYTLIGDTVNLASRLEGTTKLYRHPLIVSEYMYDIAKDHFLFRKVDNVRVKGKDKPVGIYAIYTGFEGGGGKALRSGEIPDIPTVPSLLINREMLAQYNKGLHLFNMREWETAKEYFTSAVEIDGKDYLSAVYLERTEEFLSNPPPADWDGTVSLTEK
jgi:class 3 adenylate cyclase/DNA-binding response OmpR family regulator